VFRSIAYNTMNIIVVIRKEAMITRYNKDILFEDCFGDDVLLKWMVKKQMPSIRHSYFIKTF